MVFFCTLFKLSNTYIRIKTRPTVTNTAGPAECSHHKTGMKNHFRFTGIQTS